MPVKRLIVLAVMGWFAGIILSCTDRSARNETAGLFNLDSVINTQVKLLAAEKPVFHKLTVIGDSVQSADVVNDSTGWSREFSLFRTADIHKPGLRDMYRKERHDKDGMRIEVWYSTDTAVTDTQYLKVLYNPAGNISMIEALQNIHNPIYRTRRHMKMFFRKGGRETVLDSMYVRGFQKMVTQDSVKYLSAGKVDGR